MSRDKEYFAPIPDIEDYPSGDHDEITLTLRPSLVPELPAGGRLKVLLVDPQPQMLRLGVRLLDRECEVETAVSAEDAFVRLCERRFHAVVTDFGLAGRDGLWLLRFCERRHPSTRRVLHTGDDPATFLPHLQSGLVHACVAKPATREGLLSSIIPPAGPAAG
jgi:DNA-binding NtrC family response regulator